MLEKILRESFSYNLVEVFTSKVTSKILNFNSFINDTDLIVWIALEKGDVVPSMYISQIDEALTDLSTDFAGKYLAAYKLAVQTYNESAAIDLKIEELYSE